MNKQTNLYKKWCRLPLSLAALAVVTPPVSAVTLEEVIVTATKRSESLQEVPLSVTAFSGEQIEFKEVQTAQDLQYSVPSLEVTYQNGTNLIAIRGIGSNSSSGVDDPAVAQHIDGVYQPRTQSVLLALTDLERIEVLKGPQGTLYGRNSTGGTINYVTKKPSQEFEAGISGLLGNYSRKNIKGYVSGGLTDTLSARASVYYNKQDGHLEVSGPATEDIFGDDTKGARLALRYEPSDKVSVDLTASTIDTESLITYQILDIVTPTAPSPFFFPVTLFGEHTLEENRLISDVTDSEGKTAQDSFTATVNWDINDAWSFKSISAYMENEFIQTRFEADYTILPVSTADYDSRGETLSQEFNLVYSGDRIDAVLGTFYLDDEITFDIDAPAFFSFNTFLQNTDAWAAFADLTFGVTDTFRLLGGVRYNTEEKKVKQSASLVPTCAAGAEFSEEWSDTTFKAGFQVDLSDNVMLYGTWQEGFKAGGFDTGLCGDEFDPETVEAIEIGLKSTLLDGRATLNVAAFDYDYDDRQVQEQVGVQTQITNASSAAVRGIEFEFNMAVTDNFSVEASGGYVDSEFKELMLVDTFSGMVVDLSGTQLERSPEFSANLAGQYNLNLDDGSLVTVRGELYYSDDVLHGFFGRPSDTQDSYTIQNAYVSYEPAAIEGFKIRGFVKNISDELTIQGNTEFATLGIIPGNYSIGRTYGVEVSMGF